MQSWMRRIRGAIGMGLTWATAWGTVGLVPRWIFGIKTDAPIPLIFGVLGFFAGVTFSALVVATDKRRGFERMTLRRFAGWGAAGGVLLSGVFAKIASLGLGDVLLIVPTFAAASALCACGSLALAKRAQTKELPGSTQAGLLGEGR